MNIFEFADIINKQIVIRRYPNQKGRYSADFENCEIKKSENDHILLSTFGDGKTPMSAINEYIDKISSKYLVFNAGNDNRQEFMCPKMEKKY